MTAKKYKVLQERFEDGTYGKWHRVIEVGDRGDQFATNQLFASFDGAMKWIEAQKTFMEGENVTLRNHPTSQFLVVFINRYGALVGEVSTFERAYKVSAFERAYKWVKLEELGKIMTTQAVIEMTPREILATIKELTELREAVSEELLMEVDEIISNLLNALKEKI